MKSESKMLPLSGRALLRAIALVTLLSFGVALPAEAAKKAAATKKAAPPKKGAKDAKAPEEKKALERPGDQKASSKGLEEVLKKAADPAEEEQTRLAPAKIERDPGKALTKDALADKRRDEAIEQLKKLLAKQKNPDVKADLTFQLAELWWEKSRYVKLYEEMPAFDEANEKWSKCLKEKGEKACGARPIPNHRMSELYRKNAVELYGTIIKNYPRYGRLDEIRFIMAFNKADIASGVRQAGGKNAEKEAKKLELEAIQQYRDLIAYHPKSPYVADGYVELGNYFFNNNELSNARKSYEDCLKQKSPKTETYCIYKLAWCDINSADHETAIKRFKEVIARGDKSGSDGDKVKLKTEALNDIITPFSALDYRDQAIKYFQDKAGKQNSRRYIVKLTNTYFGAGKYEQAVKMYQWLMSEYELDPNAPEWQSRVVLAYDKWSKRDMVLKEMRKLIDNYRPGTPWHNANKSTDPKKPNMATEIALALTEEALYNLVTDYHQEAIKTKSVPTYRLARDIYKEYVDNFPSTERSYNMRFYYAEILYALEEYQNAYDQYIKVGADKERDDYKRQAATNMLLAAEKLVDIEAGRYKIAVEGKKIDEGKDKGEIKDQKIAVKIDKTAKETELTKMERQLVAACDKYVELVPNAEDESRVRLRAAVLYFDKGQYVPAAKRFAFIIKRWPEEKTSATAAQLILESLEVKQAWKDLNELSREFRKNEKLLAGKGKDEFKAQLDLYIEGSAFKVASVTNDKQEYAEAAKLFREFQKEFPASKYSPIAVYNAFVIFQRAKELDTAIEMGEQLLREYPTCDDPKMRELPTLRKGEKGETRAAILPLMVFDLGRTYEQTADFASAARYYEKFATDFPADDRTPDAQFNAALWYKGLGEPDKAIAAFEKYIEIYKKKKPEEREKLKLVPDAGVAFEIALIHEAKKDWPKLIAALDKYQKDYKTEAKWKLLQAKYKQFLALKELEKLKEQREKADEILKFVTEKDFTEEDKKRESSKLAVAHCRFFTLEPRFAAYEAIKFDSPRTLANVLKKKTDDAAALKASYEGVVNDGNGDWAIAALVRMALLPKLFAKSLLEAPMPKGLDEEQQELYRATLEEKALEYEEPAITALELALSKAFELKVYNEWTLRAEELLAEFKPDLFGDVKQLPLKGSEFFFTATPKVGSGGGADAR